MPPLLMPPPLRAADSHRHYDMLLIYYDTYTPPFSPFHIPLAIIRLIIAIAAAYYYA